MPRRLDITGERFGSLVAIEHTSRDSYGRILWLFLCDCGRKTIRRSDSVKMGYVLACECCHTKSKRVSKPRTYEVQTLNNSWSSMRNRCNNPNNDNYANYGGRGITICDRWISFDNFMSDMGPKPTPEHTLERIDNNGNYEPSNCRWATRKEQQHNRKRHSNLVS